MKNDGAFYLVVRFWPAFARRRFPFEEYNQLIDEELWPALIRHAENWLKQVGSQLDLGKDTKGLIVTPERLVEIDPAQRQFFRTGVLAGWCTTQRSFYYPAATGYEILVHSAMPFLKLDNEDDARKTVEAMQYETSERFVKATWGEENSELLDFYSRLFPHYSYISELKFGDVNNRAKIELYMDNYPALNSPESFVHFARKTAEVIQRDRQSLEDSDSATTPPPPLSEEGAAILEKLDGIETRTQQLPQIAEDTTAIREDTREIKVALKTPKKVSGGASLEVSIKKMTATLNGKEYDLKSEYQARWLAVLSKNPGVWISSSRLKDYDDELDGSRTDRLRSGLPKKIVSLIETSKRTGARLKLN